MVKPDLGLIKAVFNEVDISRLQSSYQAVLQSEELLKQIEVTVGAKVSGLGNGVNLEAIKSLFKELRYCFEHYAGDGLLLDVKLRQIESYESILVLPHPRGTGVLKRDWTPPVADIFAGNGAQFGF